MSLIRELTCSAEKPGILGTWLVEVLVMISNSLMKESTVDGVRVETQCDSWY